MRAIGLFISSVVLAFGIILITFANFGTLSFSWNDFAFYIVLASVAYGIIWIVGLSLNKEVNKFVSDFINRDSKELKPSRSTLNLFGFLLINILPLLIFIQLITLYSAVLVAIGGLQLISSLERVPIALLIALPFVVFGTIWAVVLGLYRLVFPPRKQQSGFKISREDQEGIWKLTDQVAKQIGCDPIEEIWMTSLPGIGVYHSGNLFTTIFGGGRKILEIGIPSVHGLSKNEFSAILAHEYGHFNNSDTKWGAFTYQMGASLLRTFSSTPGPKSFSDRDRGWVKLIVSLNPAYWILLVFIALYFRVTNSFSRMREIMSDAHAMKFFGGRDFADGLRKVSVNDLLFSSLLQNQWLPALIHDNKPIPDLSRALRNAHSAVGPRIIKQIEHNLTEAQDSGIYNSHPAIATRLEYAKRFSGTKRTDDTMFSSVFHNWGKLSEELTQELNAQFSGFARGPVIQSSGTAKPNKVKEKPVDKWCSNCGKNFEDGSEYCSQCGKSYNNDTFRN